YAALDPQQGLCGESLYVSAALSGELDRQGFIFDFGPAKKLLKQLVDEKLDHKLLVPGSIQTSAFQSKNGEIWGYEAPLEAIARVPELNRQALENFLEEAARPLL